MKFNRCVCLTIWWKNNISHILQVMVERLRRCMAVWYCGQDPRVIKLRMPICNCNNLQNFVKSCKDEYSIWAPDLWTASKIEICEPKLLNRHRTLPLSLLLLILLLIALFRRSHEVDKVVISYILKRYRYKRACPQGSRAIISFTTTPEMHRSVQQLLLRHHPQLLDGSRWE